MSNTEDREVSVTLYELRDATLAIGEAISASGCMKGVPNDVVPLVHAYALGALMRGAGITVGSVGEVLKFVRLGYEDFDKIRKENEEHTTQ
jgi:hypothetical protein